MHTVPPAQVEPSEAHLGAVLPPAGRSSLNQVPSDPTIVAIDPDLPVPESIKL